MWHSTQAGGTPAVPVSNLILVMAHSVRGRIRFVDPHERQCRFQPAKELDLVQERIEPTIGNAVMHVERLGMMHLVMRRFQDQPRALQPAREARNAFLMRPFVKLVGRYGRRRS